MTIEDGMGQIHQVVKDMEVWVLHRREVRHVVVIERDCFDDEVVLLDSGEQVGPRDLRVAGQ